MNLDSSRRRQFGWRPSLVGGLCAALLCACAGEAEVTQLSGATMGTRYNVTVVAREPPDNGLRDDIEQELESITQHLSNYSPTSEIMRFNALQATQWVEVSPMLYEVVATAQSIAALSDGAFDITVAPLVAVWGFGAAPLQSKPPEPTAIALALARTGFRYLASRGSPAALRKHRPDVEIDVSGIAKGYAVDQIGALLAAHGHANWMVEIGGEIKISGRGPGGALWQIGVEDPTTATSTLWGVLELSAGAVASSGDYRDFFVHAGKRYTHIIDPRTGWPSATDVAAATVVHERASNADALATAVVILGSDAALEWAGEHNIALLLARRTETGIVWLNSPAFERYSASAKSKIQFSADLK